MPDMFFLMLALVFCVGGVIVSDLLKKYYVIICKVLWYFLCIAIVQLTILEQITDPDSLWGSTIIIVGSFWVSYIALSVYVAIKSTIISNSVLIPLAFLAVMNLIFMFIIVEKRLTEGVIIFSVIDVLKYGFIMLACQLPIVVITENVRHN